MELGFSIALQESYPPQLKRKHGAVFSSSWKLLMTNHRPLFFLQKVSPVSYLHSSPHGNNIFFHPFISPEQLLISRYSTILHSLSVCKRTQTKLCKGSNGLLKSPSLKITQEHPFLKKYDDNSGTNLASYFIDAWSLFATLKNLSGQFSVQAPGRYHIIIIIWLLLLLSEVSLF